MAVGSICTRRKTWDVPEGDVGRICISAATDSGGRIACRSDEACVFVTPTAVTHRGEGGETFTSDLNIMAYFVGREECRVSSGFSGVASTFFAEDEDVAIHLRAHGVDKYGDTRLVLVVPKGGWGKIAPAVLRIRFNSWSDSSGYYGHTDARASVSANSAGEDDERTIDGMEIPSGRAGYLNFLDYTRSPYVDVTFGESGEVLGMKHVAGR